MTLPGQVIHEQIPPIKATYRPVKERIFHFINFSLHGDNETKSNENRTRRLYRWVNGTGGSKALESLHMTQGARLFPVGGEIPYT